MVSFEYKDYRDTDGRGQPKVKVLRLSTSEFVARFVGADRGLKRLSLYRVANVPLGVATTVAVGEAAVTVRARAAAETIGASGPMPAFAGPGAASGALVC